MIGEFTDQALKTFEELEKTVSLEHHEWEAMVTLGVDQETAKSFRFCTQCGHVFPLCDCPIHEEPEEEDEEPAEEGNNDLDDPVIREPGEIVPVEEPYTIVDFREKTPLARQFDGEAFGLKQETQPSAANNLLTVKPAPFTPAPSCAA